MAIDINWLAILVTTIISVILGTTWFGPLFGKVWIKIVTGKTMEECKNEMTAEQKKNMWKSYVLVIIGALITNFVLLHSIVFGSAYLSMTGVASGLQAGFWNWLGFIAPALLGSVLWENRPWKYWFIVAGYYLVLLLVNGMILASWV